MTRRNSQRKRQGARGPRGEARKSGVKVGGHRIQARESDGRRHALKGKGRDPKRRARDPKGETSQRRGEVRGSGDEAEHPTAGADSTLDTVGLLCPAPIMKAAQRIKELQQGQTLEIISDDPGIEVDMPAWCRSTGNELLGIEKRGLQFHVLVRKR